MTQKTDLAAQAQVFEKIDSVIHTRNRLAIVSVLAVNPSLTFSELRDALGLTDGNFAAHLKILNDAGVIRLRKTGGEKSVTAISLTSSGRTAFAKYLSGLEQILKRHGR
jgi:DNA-binding MarR family transcriptional regulator